MAQAKKLFKGAATPGDDLSASAEIKHDAGRSRVVLNVDDDGTTENDTSVAKGAHNGTNSYSEMGRRDESVTNGGDDNSEDFSLPKNYKLVPQEHRASFMM